MIRVNKVLVKAMGKPAGIIERIVGNDGSTSYSFRYLNEYLATSKRPVHPTLPLSEQVYTANRLFPVFDNLCFEGENRTRACKHFHIDIDDSMSLLALCGDDTIGALSFEAAK